MNVLALHRATRNYGELRALNGLTLTVAPSEIHAIIGLNGAGKTTAMKACVGQSRLDAGTATLFGQPIDKAGPAEFRRLGFVIDQPFGYPELTVSDNLTLAARLHEVKTADASARAARWIERLQLDRWAHRMTRGLSLGNRQRLGIACAVIHAPDLLILDEPTNALDPAGVLLLRDVIVEAAARGAGVLISSHHLDEVSRIANHITVVHSGQAIGTLAPGEIDLERRFFEQVRQWDVDQEGSCA